MWAGRKTDRAALILDQRTCIAVILTHTCPDQTAIARSVSNVHAMCMLAVCYSGCFPVAGVYNPKKLLGVTTLDVVRANTFVAQVCCCCA